MESSQKHHNFKVCKPFGMLSQFSTNCKHQKKKHFLGDLGQFPENIMPIGRLDEDSEGLLLLTTCGKTSYYVNSSKVEKEYYAQIDGLITSEALNQLQNGLNISINGDLYKTKPCKAFKILELPELPERRKKIRDERHGPTSWVSITVTEGKFRQVRKMTAAVGFPTLRLVRVRIGAIKLDPNLFNTPKEIKQIKNFI
ncbi:pseudouridine synthase [Aurantibacter sp.]|uniref:pseudouridine synthase n=1 Tax=Aurantibacter sp. TaxID=2807103 RepID=UPI0035C8484F